MVDESENKIEDVKRHLYDPNDHVMGHQREGVLHQVNHKVSPNWQGDEPNRNNEDMNKKNKKPPMSPFKKFFIISAVFFIGALGFAFYKFSSDDLSVSNDKIDINIIGNAFTKGGDVLPLQIEITNKNNAKLESADLVVEYPKGAEDNDTEVVRLPKDVIGTIKPGETIIRSVEVKLFGKEKSIRNIKISLEYHPEGSNAIFTKDKYYPVTISIAPLSLIVDGPTSTTSNQPISFRVTATLNTSLPEESPILQITYPNNFVFDSAIPAPIVGNSVWDLSSLTPTNPIVVEVKGRLIGQDGDEQVFHAYAGTSGGSNQSVVNVVYSSILQKVSIEKPFLEANILVNGADQDDYAVSGGSTVGVEIQWANNLATRITDGQIIASLSGNAFDRSAVTPMGGFYDSANNQIIWDRNSSASLADISPGETGSVSFSFKPVSLVGTTLKDPAVSIKVSIKGREPILGSTYNDINNFTEKTVKLLSNFQIASSASYASGSMPPKAETETYYVVTWTLSNTANNISGAEARSSLPIYVKWINIISGETEKITYNEVTRDVVWNIGSVDPNTGINSNREASFIIAIKPSLSQVGTVPQLMKELYLSGTDSFTKTTINDTKGPITTSIYNDANLQTSNGRVVQ